MAWPLSLGTRFRRQLRAPKARPFGLRELTAQRGQARRLSCQECEQAPSLEGLSASSEVECFARLKLELGARLENP